MVCAKIVLVSSLFSILFAKVVYVNKAPNACFPFNMGNNSNMILSPSYPSNYTSNLYCERLIQTAPNTKVMLHFSTIDIETMWYQCLGDYLEIIDLQNNNQTIKKFCFKISPDPFVSKGNRILLRFKSNDRNNRAGFKGYYRQFEQDPKSCQPFNEGFVTQDFREFYSPNYPGYIPIDPNISCSKRIVAPVSSVVLIRFLVSYLHPCSLNQSYVKVHDGNNAVAPLKRMVCGWEAQPDFLSNGSNLYLVFQSTNRDRFSSKYFRAQYWFLDRSELANMCIGFISLEKQEIKSPTNFTDTFGFASCEGVITAPVGHRVRLRFLKLDTAVGRKCLRDYVDVRDGDSETAPLIGRYCGNHLPTSVLSSTEKLWIQFRNAVPPSNASLVRLQAKFDFVNESVPRVNDAICEMFDLTNGSFFSPNYPKPYLGNTVCERVLRAPNGSQVIVELTRIRIEYSSNCQSDFLEFRDGNSSKAPLLTKICSNGYGAEKFIKSVNSSSLFVRIKTDGSDHFGGFAANYYFFQKYAPDRLKVGVEERCGRHWQYLYDNQKCIRLIPKIFNYELAERTCNYINATLGTIESPEEQTFWQSLAIAEGLDSRNAEIWIGARRELEVNYIFLWSHRWPMTYENWAAGEPNDLLTSDCVVMMTATGKWKDVPCTRQNRFFCQKVILSAPATVLPSSEKSMSRDQAQDLISLTTVKAWIVFLAILVALTIVLVAVGFFYVFKKIAPLGLNRLSNPHNNLVAMDTLQHNYVT